MSKNTHQEQRIKFEANIRAIENAVNNASLDGGCDFSEDVIYHCEILRSVFEEMNTNVGTLIDNQKHTYE